MLPQHDDHPARRTAAAPSTDAQRRLAALMERKQRFAAHGRAGNAGFRPAQRLPGHRAR